MLNPLKNLKGKLNHIRVPPVQLMRVYEIANSIQGKGASLVQDGSISADEILELRSDGGKIDERRFHKF